MGQDESARPLVPDSIVNNESLWSVTSILDESLIFIRQIEDGLFGTVHKYEPAEAGVLAAISVQFKPLSVEYSILTILILELVHMIFCVVPAIKVSPPLGEVILTLMPTFCALPVFRLFC